MFRNNYRCCKLYGRMSKKCRSNLYSNLICKIGQDFMDRRYVKNQNNFCYFLHSWLKNFTAFFLLGYLFIIFSVKYIYPEKNKKAKNNLKIILIEETNYYSNHKKFTTENKVYFCI